MDSSCEECVITRGRLPPIDQVVGGWAPPLWVNGKPDSTNLQSAVVGALRPEPSGSAGMQAGMQVNQSPSLHEADEPRKGGYLAGVAAVVCQSLWTRGLAGAGNPLPSHCIPFSIPYCIRLSCLGSNPGGRRVDRKGTGLFLFQVWVGPPYYYSRWALSRVTQIDIHLDMYMSLQIHIRICIITISIPI